MRDPELLDEAARLKIRIAPTDGAVTVEMVSRLFATPAPVVERIQTILERASR
jgi:hypothetical protein